MEEIKIYHSPWRMLLLVLASLAFAGAGFFMTIHSPKGFHIIVGWIFLYGSQTVFIFCSKAFGLTLRQEIRFFDYSISIPLHVAFSHHCWSAWSH